MSSALVVEAPRIPAMSSQAIAKVAALEALLAQAPQVPIATHHVLHGGLYARTIRIPAGVILTGALIKLATVLVVSGHVSVAIDGESVELAGYHVLPAAANRKQAFVAHADTDLTMIFPTTATSVEAAEDQFTDEADLLFSRQGENVVVITGE